MQHNICINVFIRIKIGTKYFLMHTFAPFFTFAVQCAQFWMHFDDDEKMLQVAIMTKSNFFAASVGYKQCENKVMKSWLCFLF